MDEEGLRERHNGSVEKTAMEPEPTVVKVDKKADGEDEEEVREQWDSPAEFILSSLGYAVGLGNVWRFPYLCYVNGGGAFLIPYFLMLTFVGIPCFMLESAMGQYHAAGPMTVWNCAPLFRGVGAGMLIISFIGSIYYNMIITWSLYYLFASWQKVLPWSTCDNDFNTPVCYSKKQATPCEETDGLFYNNTCYNASAAVYSKIDTTSTACNETDCWLESYNFKWRELTNITMYERVSASEEYLRKSVLAQSPTIDDDGGLKWDLTLCLLLAWIICYLCMIKGIKSSGKVVYFTATFPYVIILILLIRGALLPGALEGIKFYIIPKWEKLATPKVWADAAGQIFFSISVGMGGLMTFTSYNKFHNNIYRDSLFVAICNCLTSFLAGFAIFSILGYLSFTLNKPVEDVVSSGSALAFVAYPEVVLWLEPPQLWATLFFFMLLTLGLDSQFASIECVLTGLVDSFPVLKKKRMLVNAALCVLMFFLGLTQCTRAGLYWTDLMSYYSSGWSLILMGLSEGIIFPWVYGANRVIDDIHHMCGFKLHIHWWIVWKFVTPVLLIAILIFNFYSFTPLSVGDYELPPWAQGLGWVMAVASVGMIPIFAVIAYIRSGSDPEYSGLAGCQRFIALCRPNKKWGPARGHSPWPPGTVELPAVNGQYGDKVLDNKGLPAVNGQYETISGPMDNPAVNGQYETISGPMDNPAYANTENIPSYDGQPNLRETTHL